MEQKMDYTPEELQEILEKAKRDLQETLAKMTPEERAQAQARAQKMMEEDRIATEQLLKEAAKYTSGTARKKEKPKFCANCGAPTDSGNFCAYCGNPL